MSFWSDLGSNINWGNLLNAGVNYLAGQGNASANQSAANNYANQVKFNPYNILTPNAGVSFNGNTALASLTPDVNSLQTALLGKAGGLLGGLDYTNGGISPFLQNSFDTYNQQSPSTAGLSQLGDQYNASAQGFLGGLGSFDPNQAAADYTNNLRAQAQPDQQRAAQSLAQGLFNTGRLGSTGGANLFGQLINQQNQQDLGFQLAGKQYAGQEQNRLAGLASQFGQQYGSIQDQINNRASQRFQNAMQLFGAGQQNLNTQLTGGLSALNGSNSLNDQLLHQIQLGGYLGGAQSSANSNAYSQPLQAQVAGNNANSAGLMGLLDSTGLTNMAGNYLNGLFTNTSGLGNSISNYGTQATNDLLNNSQWWGSLDPSWGFSGAGGQAAGLLGSIPNGLQNLDYASQFNNMSDPELYKALGINDSIANGSAFNAGNVLSGLGSAANIYSGLQRGGVAGYGAALGGAANLAGLAGYGGGATQALGALGNALSGNVAGLAGNLSSLAGSGASSGAAAGGSSGATTAAGGLASSAALGLAAAGLVLPIMDEINSPSDRKELIALYAKQGQALLNGTPQTLAQKGKVPDAIYQKLRDAEIQQGKFFLNQAQSMQDTKHEISLPSSPAIKGSVTTGSNGLSFLKRNMQI